MVTASGPANWESASHTLDSASSTAAASASAATRWVCASHLVRPKSVLRGHLPAAYSRSPYDLRMK
jgi:hypothetical protein